MADLAPDVRRLKVRVTEALKDDDHFPEALLKELLSGLMGMIAPEDRGPDDDDDPDILGDQANRRTLITGQLLHDMTDAWSTDDELTNLCSKGPIITILNDFFPDMMAGATMPGPTMAENFQRFILSKAFDAQVPPEAIPPPLSSSDSSSASAGAFMQGSGSRLSEANITCLSSSAILNNILAAAPKDDTSFITLFSAINVIAGNPDQETSLTVLKGLSNIMNKSELADSDAKAKPRTQVYIALSTIASRLAAEIAKALSHTGASASKRAWFLPDAEAALNLAISLDMDKIIASLHMFSSFTIVTDSKTKSDKMNLDQARDAFTNLLTVLEIVFGNRVGASTRDRFFAFVDDISHLNREAKAYPGGFWAIINDLPIPAMKHWAKALRDAIIRGGVHFNVAPLDDHLQLSAIEQRAFGTTRVFMEITAYISSCISRKIDPYDMTCGQLRDVIGGNLGAITGAGVAHDAADFRKIPGLVDKTRTPKKDRATPGINKHLTKLHQHWSKASDGECMEFNLCPGGCDTVDCAHRHAYTSKSASIAFARRFNTIIKNADFKLKPDILKSINKPRPRAETYHYDDRGRDHDRDRNHDRRDDYPERRPDRKRARNGDRDRHDDRRYDDRRR